MTSSASSTKESTIVRLAAAIVVAATLAGCSTLGPRNALGGECPTDQTLMCETFGPERACTCEDRGRVMRQFPAFGSAAFGLVR